MSEYGYPSTLNVGVFVDFYCLKQNGTFTDAKENQIVVERNEAEEKEVGGENLDSAPDRQQFYELLNDVNLVFFMADRVIVLSGRTEPHHRPAHV